MGRGRVAPVAHDTAWVARVSRAEAPNVPAFPEAIDWLLRNQHGDGTWGGRLAHHQDRVLSTLAAMLAISQWREVNGAAEAYTDRLHAAGWGIAPHMAALGRDPCALPGFDGRLAALITEARWRRLVLAFSTGIAGTVDPDEEAWAGPADRSPADTARRLLRHPDDRTARAHLEGIVAQHAGGAGPALSPQDLLEPAAVLHNVALAWPEHPGRAGGWAPAIASLRAGYLRPAPTEGDRAGLALAFRVLSWAGEEPDPTRLRGPLDEREAPADRPYQPFPLVGAHLHHLAALRAAPPFEGREAAIRKAVGFLARTATTDPFWVDGRHASPFYATANAVIALGPDLSLTEEAVAWIAQTQRPDGSWGFFERSTLEESAYCVQALACHRRAGGSVKPGAIEAGGRWIEQARAATGLDYEPLWVGQTLFTPTWVVHSAVLSALILARD